MTSVRGARRAAARLLALLALTSGCSCEGDDPVVDGGGADDAGAPFDADLHDAAHQVGDADAGGGADASGLDASDVGEDDAGIEVGWSAVDDVVDGMRGLRVAMRGTSDGRVVVVFKDVSGSETLRAMRWHGGDAGGWTDLGIVNDGVAGALETGGDPEFRYVGIAPLEDERVLVAFRQGGAVHANVFDGTSFGAPRLVSAQPSAIAVASDGHTRALVAYATGDSRVAVRGYDAASDTFGVETPVDVAGRTLELPDTFVVLAGLAANGDALVVSIDRPGTSSYRVMTSRYSAVDELWTEETNSSFDTSMRPTRPCLSVDADGTAVLSFAERFTNSFGTFVRARGARRLAGDTTWGSWATFDGVPMHDACAVSDDGTAFLATLVATGTGSDIVPHRYVGTGWTTDAVVGATLTTGSSRALVAAASGGRASVLFQRTSSEVRLVRFDADAWSSAPNLAYASTLDTNLDQFFKGSVSLDDGRVLWVFQESQGRLRYAVHR